MVAGLRICARLAEDLAAPVGVVMPCPKCQACAWMPDLESIRQSLGTRLLKVCLLCGSCDWTELSVPAEAPARGMRYQHQRDTLDGIISPRTTQRPWPAPTVAAQDRA
jgi:hypothetical protein